MITGATSGESESGSAVASNTDGQTGLGRYTAQVLAQRGLHVVIACRNMELGHAEVARLRKATQNPHIVFAVVCLRSHFSLIFLY